MKISLAWLNSMLVPGGLSAEAAEGLLTSVGLPVETIEAVETGAGIDRCLDVEVTSNRGDALCHLTMAREIAAVSAGKQSVKRRPESAAVVAAKTGSEGVESAVTLRNEVPEQCPRFTLRVIKGVKIGPSPAWLVDALAGIGQRSINNVVDITNYVQAELGNPSHVFDLATLKAGPDGKPAVIVRAANKGEKLKLLDGKTVELMTDEIVVADAERAVSLAGVMGGEETGVTERTTDVLLEVATWSPVRVRKASRRLNITSDAGYRFQRQVDARTLDAASERLAELIVELAGGKLCKGMLDQGVWTREPVEVMLRARRVREVIGVDFADAEIDSALRAQGFTLAPGAGSGEWRVSVPAGRTDVKLEIDLIEEVARTLGYERIATPEMMSVRVNEPQRQERAGVEVARVLTGAGFFETVTFTFVNAKGAKAFVGKGAGTISVSDERRGAEGVLRPSVITGLLGCRRVNQDRRVAPAGNVRLYETSAVFADVGGKHAERMMLGLLADVPTHAAGAALGAFERKQMGLRIMAGVIESLAASMMGSKVMVRMEPAGDLVSAYEAGAAARVWVGVPGAEEKAIGVMGLLSAEAMKQHEIEWPVVAAELDYEMLIAGYPARATVEALPVMSAVERDVSLIVDEKVTWEAVRASTLKQRLEHLEALSFVMSYRGKPIPEGKKSVTLRMRFRHPEKTFRDEEVNGPVEGLIAELKKELGAEVRTG